MMKSNKKQSNHRGIYIWTVCVVVIVLVLAFNFLMNLLENRFNLRADLSQYQVYSLTQETENVLDSLSQPVEIYSLYTASSEDSLTKELLEKYKAYSPKVKYENVDPLKNPTFAQAFDPDKNGIAVNSIIVMDEARKHYKVISQDQLYILDSSTGSVLGTMAEQYITSAVNYIETGIVKSVKVLTGHDEAAPSSYLTLLNALSSRGYEMASYNTMTSADPLDPMNDTLLVVSPKSDLSDDEYAAISEFLTDGGKALIIMQNLSVDSDSGDVKVLTDKFPNFAALLLEYDMSVNKDIIIGQDETRYYGQVTSLVPEIQAHEITVPIIQAGGNVVMSINSSINVPQVQDGDVTVSPLLVTDESCYAKSLENMTMVTKEPNDKQGAFVIGALAEKGGSRLALFTSEAFFTDTAIETANNYELAVNTLSYLGEQENSITIQPKQIRGDLLQIQNQFQKNLLSVIVIAVLPAAIIIAGVFVWRKRRRL
jgi:ABC-2 type transport system permease protein